MTKHQIRGKEKADWKQCHERSKEDTTFCVSSCSAWQAIRRKTRDFQLKDRSKILLHTHFSLFAFCLCSMVGLRLNAFNGLLTFWCLGNVYIVRLQSAAMGEAFAYQDVQGGRRSGSCVHTYFTDQIQWLSKLKRSMSKRPIILLTFGIFEWKGSGHLVLVHDSVLKLVVSCRYICPNVYEIKIYDPTQSMSKSRRLSTDPSLQ